MFKLLKADLYRILKSKLTIVALIICVAMPLLVALMYKTFEFLPGMSEEDIQMMQTLGGFNARTVMASTYALSSNAGLVIPAFAGIFVVMDFSSGSLRNKIIAGNKRQNIYMSHLFATIIFAVVMVSIYALFNALFGNLLLPYSVELTTDEIWNIAKFYIAGTVTFIFAASFTALLAMLTHSIPLVIIISIVGGSIISLAGSLLPMLPIDNIEYFAALIPSSSSSKIGVDNIVFVEGILTCLMFTVLNTVLGSIIFYKKDIK